MNKLLIIIKREYLSKVKKKSFIALTILGPILLVLLMVLPTLLMENSMSSYNIEVVDSTPKTVIEGDTISFFEGKYKSNEIAKFSYNRDIVKAQEKLKKGEVDMVVEIVKSNDKPPIKAFYYIADNEPSVEAKEEVTQQTQQIFKNSLLMVSYNMSREDIAMINNPQIDTYITNINTGEESFSTLKMVLGGVLGIMIYCFIFLFGGQIMRSVSEEKGSRIIEVLISSVKSIDLFFGKIIAVALVGLTQFALWIVLSLILVTGVKIAQPDLFKTQDQQKIELTDRVISADKLDTLDMDSNTTNQIMKEITSINFPLILSMFAIYFLLGYLLYGALFGAVGSLVDEDADAGQFSLPLTVPFIFAIVCLPMVMSDPSSSVATWLSIIPFTSPVTMLVRIPFGVPTWQVLLSIGLLLLTMIICMRVASRIYRKGILVYGKQIQYKDLFSWLKKN
jgi:ABC-2 type transport system permease protein